jgi:hypothetical protein
MAAQPVPGASGRHRGPGPDHRHRRRDHHRRIARRRAGGEAPRGRRELSHQSRAERAGGAANDGDRQLTNARPGAPRGIVPAGPPDLSFFLLGRVSATGNYCCELLSGQDETVYGAKGTTISYDPLRIYKIRGVFEAGLHVDKVDGVSLFRVRNAQLEEAVGAKIFKVGQPWSMTARAPSGKNVNAP